MSNTRPARSPASRLRRPRPGVSRIAVGVNGFPEGRDAVAFAEMLARGTGADTMLVNVHTDPMVVLPSGMNWTALEREAQLIVRETCKTLAPEARGRVETDLSVVRGLERVVRREHRDLLVVGSSRHAAEGRVLIGKRTRQLLDHGVCAVAVAPRGFHQARRGPLAEIGVGYDGGPESRAALNLAASLATASGAKLNVWSVIDDRIRSLGWSRIGTGAAIMPGLGWEPTGSSGATAEWEKILEASVDVMRTDLEGIARDIGAATTSQVRLGRPATALLELAEKVDLLVIGSRRWGALARVILGSTGEALLHDAPCGVLVVPRPRDSSDQPPSTTHEREPDPENGDGVQHGDSPLQ